MFGMEEQTVHCKLTGKVLFSIFEITCCCSLGQEIFQAKY